MRVNRTPNDIIAAFSLYRPPFIGRQQVTLHIPKKTNMKMSEFDYITNNFTNAIGITKVGKNISTTTVAAPRGALQETYTLPINPPSSGTQIPPRAPSFTAPRTPVAQPINRTEPGGGGDMGGGGGGGGGGGAPGTEERSAEETAGGAKPSFLKANFKYILGALAGAGAGWYVAKNQGWNKIWTAIGGAAAGAGAVYGYAAFTQKAPIQPKK